MLWEALAITSFASLLMHLVLLGLSFPWKKIASISLRIWSAMKDSRQRKRSQCVPGRPAWSCPTLLSCQYSRRYSQLCLILIGNYSLGTEADIAIGQWSLPELWIFRVLVLLLFLFSKDKEADSSTLEQTGAGCGLVMNARELKSVLKSHLSRQSIKVKAVKRYKGTLFRMSETLAVSYRWQGAEQQVEGLGPVNMSDWQMEELTKAIESSKCLYVWLDRISVPQEEGQLKKVLLSRMMSVYASSMAVLCLLTREANTHRYHQRMWTLQEYCTAKSLIVIQDTNGAGEEESDMVATTTCEQDKADQLRMEHMARQPTCMPVWLSNNCSGLASVPTTRVKAIWETYLQISTDRFCAQSSDAIRALRLGSGSWRSVTMIALTLLTGSVVSRYPLLWNSPAEREEELVQLMDLLETLHGIPQRESKQLLARSSRSFGADVLASQTKSEFLSHQSPDCDEDTPPIAAACEAGDELPGQIGLL
eukprot:scaffold407127_cov47-Prasinocladus_malaysianus.AAC.2